MALQKIIKELLRIPKGKLPGPNHCPAELIVGLQTAVKQTALPLQLTAPIVEDNVIFGVDIFCPTNTLAVPAHPLKVLVTVTK